MITKSGLLFLLMLGWVAGVSAQVSSSASAQAAAPGIAFDSTTFNFGRVKSGEPVKHSFIFTNTGAATLEITEVKPGCGCTTAGAWDKEVEPGKTGVIPLQYNSTGYSGPVSKSATVTCNDPVHSKVILQIAGTVWKPIDITPPMATFNLSAEASTNETQVLRLVSNLAEPITLSEVHSSHPAFRVELKEVKAGKEFELLVTAVGPFTSPTVFSTITLKTSSTNVPSLSVSAYAMIQQAVAVTPLQVTLPPGPLKSPVTSAVLVRNNGTNALTISDVSLNLPGVELKVTEPQTGRLYSIAMKFPAGFQVAPGQMPELTFKSNHPAHPLLKVPVVQTQLPAGATAPPSGAATPPPASSGRVLRARQ